MFSSFLSGLTSLAIRFDWFDYQTLLVWLAVDWVLIRFIMLLLNDEPRRSRPPVRLLHETTMVTQIASTTMGITIQGTIDATSSSTKVKKLVSVQCVVTLVIKSSWA